MNSTTSTTTTSSINSSTRHSSSSSSSSSSTTQACAACKYQRRRCTPDCTLAPYFPAEAQRQFLNAHRLFGVSNILKVLRGLDDPLQRAHAMRSIIFHSNARAADPVGGAYRIVIDLERQCTAAAAELALVLHHLALYREQQQQQLQYENIPPNLLVNENVIYESGNDGVDQAQYYDYFGGGNNNNINNNNDISVGSSGSVNNIHNGEEVELEVLQSMPVLAEDEVRPFMDMFDMRQALVGTMGDEDEPVANVAKADHESFHYSSEMASNDEPNPILEHVQEHDLRGAASLFTLTSHNNSYV